MQFRVGPWLVRPDMDSIVRDGQARHISPKAMEVLSCLARRQGQVVGKEEFFSEVWKETFVSDDALIRCIGELRRAFDDGAHEPAIIRTIAKRGYLLLPPVVWEPNGTAPLPASDAGELAVTACPDEGALSPLNITEADRQPARLPVQRQAWKRRWWLAAVSAGCVAAVLLFVNARRDQILPQAPLPHAIRSIAVLPLANLSSDPEQEYFADGMTDELITELAQLGVCDVISRTSVMRYKGTKQPIGAIAHELAVDGVIEGTVLRSGTRVRITAQLIDAATDRHAWSGSFEREMSDVLSLQAGLARTIAAQLNLTLIAQAETRAKLARKVVPEAYEAYLRGWYFFDRGQYPKAALYFEQAAISDPNFALAHALLFEADAMDTFVQDLPLRDRALKAMERARQLDDNLAEVRDAVGDVELAKSWNWEGGEAEYRRAIELDPGSVDAALHYLYCLHELTRWQEAEQQIHRALRVDPVSPTINLEMLRLLVDTHRYELAQEQFRKVVELDPNSGAPYDEMVTVYAALGKEDEAIAAFLKAESLRGTSPEQIDALAAAARSGGFHGCLRKKIGQLREKAQHGRVSPQAFAGLYARLGDRDESFEFLEESYRQHSIRMIWIKARAIWDPLRPDPRYQSLLRRMRFPG
jgi:TolB-like protein/DNA-binding winged helix-turn-helix (wHTH) protein/Tfp pilus assembly protein PilF